MVLGLLGTGGCKGSDAPDAPAEGAGAEIRRINLGEMDFAPAFSGYDDPYAKEQAALEPDLRAWQEAIAWADHVVVVHPYWWGAMPTRAKAVLDRALTSGDNVRDHLFAIRAWKRPEFPVGGDDALAAGLEGPQIGKVLRALEEWWMEQDFQPEREELLSRMAKRS